GLSALTDSSIAPVESMWMHFQGQMSTQPSHMMHSAWSMWRNCLGLTALVSHFGSTSCSTYEVENSGIGGFASVRATSRLRRDGTAVCAHAFGAARAQPGERPAHGLLFVGVGLGGFALLPGNEEPNVQHQHDDVDQPRECVDEF